MKRNSHLFSDLIPINPFKCYRLGLKSLFTMGFSVFTISDRTWCFSVHTTVSIMAPVARQPKRMPGCGLSICFLLACMSRGITYQTCLFTFVNVHDSTAHDHHLIFLLTIYWYLCQVNPNMRSSFFILIQQIGQIISHYIALNTGGAAKLLDICFEICAFL